MRDLIRAGLLAGMWVIYTLTSIALFAMAYESRAAFFFLVALGITGVLTVVFMMATMWLLRNFGAPRDAHQQTVQAVQAATAAPSKTKRTQADRVTRLVEALDEDEIADLEALLLDRWQDDVS